jgi:hypothetical protein
MAQVCLRRAVLMAQQPVLSALNPLPSDGGDAFLLKRLAHFSVADAKSSALLAKNARSADIKKFASVMAISSFHSQQERDEMKKATCFAHLFL